MKIEVNLNKSFVFLILGFILIFAGVFVAYSLPAGQVPSPGHGVEQLGAPLGCLAGQVLQWSGSSWECGSISNTNYVLTTYNYTGRPVYNTTPVEATFTFVNDSFTWYSLGKHSYCSLNAMSEFGSENQEIRVRVQYFPHLDKWAIFADGRALNSALNRVPLVACLDI